jgi:hypothetical protein
MQRFTALITLAAFLLVITLPMLPVPPACAHSAMVNDEACKTACHDETPTITPDDMNMSDFEMDLGTKHTHDDLLSKQELSSEKPPKCRIECGCGCNNSPDEFTLVLPPHVPSHPMALIEPIASEFAPEVATIETTRNNPPDSPPPRLS